MKEKIKCTICKKMVTNSRTGKLKPVCDDCYRSNLKKWSYKYA